MAGIIKGTAGVITSYRRSKHRIHPKQILCKFDGFDTKADAARLIGRQVEWVSPTGKRIRGKITRVHGGNGVVRVHMKDKGVPGQAIGDTVRVL